MNYFGVFITSFSTILYVFVKPEIKVIPSLKTSDTLKVQSNCDRSFIDDFHPSLKRKIGVFFAILSGIFYGTTVSFINNYAIATTNIILSF